VLTARLLPAPLSMRPIMVEIRSGTDARPQLQ
jgi:hypothetical protein